MEQRDYLKDQIEQLGKVLRNILAHFLGMKDQGQVTQGMALADQQLKQFLGLDLEEICRMSESALEDYVIKGKLQAEHLEIISGYLTEKARIIHGKNKIQSKIYFEKALALLHLADSISGTLSLDRIEKKNAIARWL